MGAAQLTYHRKEHSLARAILAAAPDHRDAEGVEAVTGAGLTEPVTAMQEAGATAGSSNTTGP